MSKNRNVATVTTELLPPEPPKAATEVAQIARIVKEQVAAILADREDLTLRPFFDTHNLAAELRRLQKMPARRKWAVYFERHGCLICRTKRAFHMACGMCNTCYERTARRLRFIVGERFPSEGGPRFTGDMESVARKALLEAVESFQAEPKRGGQ